MKNASIQTEIDSSYLYKILADHEENPVVKEVFIEMSEIEYGHAASFAKSNNISESRLPKPSFRARTLNWLGGILGFDFVLGILMDTEKKLSRGITAARSKTGQTPSISDTSHIAILKNILDKNTANASSDFARFEKKHRSVGGNALRAAVLGGNDGLLSTFSLIMGVAGAMATQNTVVITGIAGLLAGSLAMALGEWISVKSSQELYENQMNIEMEELRINPEGEQREIALIYRTKGIDKDRAAEMASELIKDREKAHEFLVKEELGINSEELKGSAWEAAFASFFMFATGGILPLLPFFFVGGSSGIVLSVTLSMIGLFLIGGVITLFTGRNFVKSGLRMVLFGLIAAAITFGIGRLIGVNIQ